MVDRSRRAFLRLLGAAPLAASACGGPEGAAVTLLNASYDPTYALYREINAAFARAYQAKAGVSVAVRQSHGGSGKQARAVLDGLEADVVTLGLGYDVEALAKAGLVAPGWAARLPDGAAPYTSTIALLVRKGNPRGIRDLDDLARPGVRVIAANPKTSGAARWGFLAAWAFAREAMGAGEAGAFDFVRRVFRNVPVLDTGARAATTTFVQRGLGDALISWESEALLAARDLWPGEVEVVTPSVSVLAEPTAAVVDAVVDRRGTRGAAEAYAAFLYTDEAQRAAARHFYRPRSPAALAAARAPFPALRLAGIADFGGWAEAHARHFADGGTFDRIYR